MTDIDLAQIDRMNREHEAWLNVVKHMRAHGVGDINAGGEHEDLHDAIVLWGEELAQLRMHDPDPSHAARALEERREKGGYYA